MEPDRPAIVMAASGQVMTYGELDARSNQSAHFIRSLGLAAGDVLAAMIENRTEFFEIAWAAQRTGLHFVCIPTRLAPGEVRYIVEDSGAKAFVASAPFLAELGDELAQISRLQVFALARESSAGSETRCWLDEAGGFPTMAVRDERAGNDMLYSSGTTGRPKGVKTPLPQPEEIGWPTRHMENCRTMYGLGADSVYLSPAPLYHAAPLRWAMSVHRLGGLVVVMERFDADQALSLIERYRVTHSQWVPTHFSRLLEIPFEKRSRYDLSSQRFAVHAAAPCPVATKSAMLEWWGPIIYEYYGGTEGNGTTVIGPAEWIVRPGSVGRAAIGTIHILDEDGEELSRGEEGTIYFEGGARFIYHNDPEKTGQAYNRSGWSTLGDIGRLDEGGYLYLTDRKSFMIISGGVNVYPQEIENLLILHPAVRDVAVIGAPDADMGERVVAVIEAESAYEAGPELAQELLGWLRPQLSGVKAPKQIDFVAELPREPTGKLIKRRVRDSYWPSAGTDGARAGAGARTMVP